MEEKIYTQLVDIVEDSQKNAVSYQREYETMKSEYFTPLEKEFGVLSRNLSLSLRKNQKYLNELKNEIRVSQEVVEPVYRQIRQLNISNRNVSSCINVVEEFLDLKFRIEEIDVALAKKDYLASCTHVNKALQNPNSQKVEEIKVYQLRLFSEIRGEFEKNRTSIAEIIKCAKYFSLIGMKDEGIEIYTDYLKEMLEKETNLQLELNVKNCKMFKSEERQYTYCTLLTLVIDTIASCLERNKKFIIDNYGRERLYILIIKFQAIFNNCFRVIFKPYLAQLQDLNKNDKIPSRDLDMILEELSVSYERLVIFLSFMDREFAFSVSSPEKERQIQKKKKKKKRVKQLDQKEAEGHLMNIMAMYLVVDNLFFRRSVGVILENIRETMDLKRSKSMVSSSAGATIGEQLSSGMGIRRNSAPSQAQVAGEDSLDSSSESDSESTSSDSSDEEEEGSSHLNRRKRKKSRRVRWESEFVFDFFMVFRRSLERSKHTNEKQIICATINQVLRIVNDELKEILFRPLEYSQYSGNGNGIVSLSGGGGLASEGGDKLAGTAWRKLERVEWNGIIVCLNDIRKTCEFLKKLKSTFERRVSKRLRRMSEAENDMVLVRLQDFLVTSKRLEEELARKIGSFIDLFILPLFGNFPELAGKKYEITEDEYNNSGLEHTWADRFVMTVNRLLTPYKHALLGDNFDLLIKTMVKKVLKLVKVSIMKKKFNIFGGLLFDSEMRSIQKFFSGAVQGTLREVFVEMNQICSLLRLKSNNEYQYLINEYFRLSSKEQKKVLSLRVDFS